MSLTARLRFILLAISLFGINGCRSVNNNIESTSELESSPSEKNVLSKRNEYWGVDLKWTAVVSKSFSPPTPPSQIAQMNCQTKVGEYLKCSEKKSPETNSYLVFSHSGEGAQLMRSSTPPKPPLVVANLKCLAPDKENGSFTCVEKRSGNQPYLAVRVELAATVKTYRSPPNPPLEKADLHCSFPGPGVSTRCVSHKANDQEDNNENFSFELSNGSGILFFSPPTPPKQLAKLICLDQSLFNNSSCVEKSQN